MGHNGLIWSLELQLSHSNSVRFLYYGHLIGCYTRLVNNASILFLHICLNGWKSITFYFENLRNWLQSMERLKCFMFHEVCVCLFILCLTSWIILCYFVIVVNLMVVCLNFAVLSNFYFTVGTTINTFYR